MKKLLTLLILTFTLIGSFTFNVFAIDVDYSFNITDNKKWNLNTGLIEDDVRYSITSKMIIRDERIDTISQSYHHVLFWNKQNQFIGYKNTQYSLYQNDKYIGYIEYGNLGFNAPENAHFYSFMIYKSGNNVLYDELNDQTLNDIFDDFNNSNLGDKENPILDNYTINQFAENTHIGKNLLSSKWELGSILNGLNVSASTQSRTIDYISIEPNTLYKISQYGVSKTVNFVWYDLNRNFINTTTASNATSPTNAYFVRFYYGTGYQDTTNFQLELGSTATPYEPYNQYLTKDQFKDFETIPNVNYVESDNNRLRYVMNEDVITSNDQPLYELNGLTLNDVFRDEAKDNNDIYPISNRALTIQQTETYYKWETLSNVSSYMLNIDLQTNLNDNLYIRYEGQLSESGSMVHRFQYTSTNQFFKTFTANERETFSYIANSPTNNNGLSFGFPYGTINAQHEIFNLIYLNLNNLGLENVSKQQLDQYYEIYFYFKDGGTAPQSFTYETPIYYDITYRLDTYFNGLDITPTEFNYWLDAYERINDSNNPPINDIVSYYYIEYAKAENPTINLTDLEWYEYYNNWLTFTNGNDREIEALNQLSLNNIFNDNQLLSNANFNNGATDWLFNVGSYNISNGIVEFTTTAQNQAIYRTENYNIGNVYYNVARAKTTALTIALRNYALIGSPYQYVPTTNEFEIVSILGIAEDASSSLQMRHLTSSNFGTHYLDYIYLYDLTFLGIDSQSKSQMDVYYQEWIDNKQIQENLYLLALQSTSFNLIYPSYDYTEPAPDTFLDVDSETFLGNILTNIGFDNDLGRIGLSLVILFVMALSLIRLNMPNSVIIGVEVLTFVGLSFLGWLPAWINIVIALGIIILLYLRFSGNGGGSNEEND